MHSHQHHQHDLNPDWAEMVADITLEGEVVMPYVTETVSSIAALCRQGGLAVRRVIDIGSGPGVATCVLAQQFDDAAVVAVDGSREMLERAAARADALGLSGRVRTQQAELPAGLNGLGHAELVWMAMVLHHVDDPAAALHGLRSILEPNGLLAIAEFGDSARFLPDDVGVGPPGFRERLGDFNPADAFPSVDYPELIEASGFELLVDRMVEVRLDPPLAEGARRVARRYLQRMLDLMGDRLDAQDRATLDVLLAEEAPLGLMRRPDAFLVVSRRIYVARAVPAGWRWSVARSGPAPPLV
jgi:SAM-dependent methyltransferase